jgi:hypothetical protein
VTRWRITFGLLALVIACLFIDPVRATIGSRDHDSYQVIRDALKEKSNSKSIYLAIYDDFYSIEPNFRLRAETDESFVETNYNKVLSAASLGDSAFNAYLRQNRITHVVVPLSSASKREIWHKWGRLGSVSIRLNPPYFREVAQTFGEFPVVLYEVLTSKSLGTTENSLYSLEWSGVRKDFYELQRSINEVGMYRYDYSKFYSDGTDVSWVMQGTNSYTEKPEFSIRTPNLLDKPFSVEITLLAAYGGNAPTQIIRVSTSSGSQLIMVTAGKSAVLRLQLASDELVSFDNVLPCRLPSTFDSSNGDQRRFCYGIGDIKVRVNS